MADQDDLYLENLNEFVNDENKIITYKGLSSLLNVSANRAKQMLSCFIQQQSSKGNDLNVTFFLGGIPSGPRKGYKFVIVNKGELEDIKSKFSQISCCHVYSVQKVKIKNFDILHGTDFDVIKSSLFDWKSWSNIYCGEAKLSDAALQRQQTTEEHAVLANGLDKTPEAKSGAALKQEVASKPNTSSSGKQVTSTTFFGTSNAKQKKGRHVAPESDSNDKLLPDQGKQETAVGTQKEERKGMSFFGKSVSDKKNSQSLSPVKKRGSESKEKKGEIQERETLEIAAKQNNKDNKRHGQAAKKESAATKEDQRVDKSMGKSSKKTKRTAELKTASEEPNVKKRKTDAANSESDDDDFESFIKSSKGKDKETCSGGKSKDSKKGETRKKDKKLDFEEPDVCEKESKEISQCAEDIECSEKTQTKRVEPSKKKLKAGKKYLEDDMEEANSEDVEASANEPEQETPQETKPKEKARIRRKVLKSKTFMNDEGYMVTEKVYESESASEESEPEEKAPKVTDIAHMKPKDITRENKKIKAEASKNKTQSSLMNFFKKK